MSPTRAFRRPLRAGPSRPLSGKRFVHNRKSDLRNDCEADRALRVLHVLDHSVPLHSGYSFRTLAILKEQRALGWETFHLTSPKQGPVGGLQEQMDGLVVNRTLPLGGLVSEVPGVRHLALIQKLTSRLREVVDAVHPDVIHVHSPVLNAMAALRVGREFDLPVVYEIRAFWEDAAADHGTAREWGSRYRLSRALEIRAARRADAVTTICGGLRTDLVDRGVPGETVTVVPNAVDVQRFAKPAAPDQGLMQGFDLQAGCTLGFAGSFYSYEGLDLLVRAMPQIVEKIPAARLLLVGGGPQECALRRLCAELGLEGVARFAGRVPHEDVERYYSVMDLTVYPRISRRLTELVTPLKPLESMAMGKVVLASDVGGHRELIKDEFNGYLFAAGSVEAVANRVIEVLQGRHSWDALNARARRYVESERTWQMSVAKYRDVYCDALRRAGERRAIGNGG